MNAKCLSGKSLPLWIQGLLFTLLFFSVFELTISPLKSFGNTAIDIFLIIVFFLFVFIYIEHYFFDVRLKGLYLVIVSYFLIILVSMFLNKDYNIELFLRIASVFLFIIMSIQTQWHKYSFIYISMITTASLFLLLIDYRFGNFDYEGISAFKSIFGNPNGLSIIIFSSTYFTVATLYYSENIYLKLLMSTNLILSLYIIIQTHSRSVYVSIAIVLLVLIINMFRPRWLYYSFFASIGTGFIFLLSYVLLPNTTFGIFLNDLSISLFNKSFFSGREKIWSELWDYILNSPMIGHGISVDSNHIDNISTSAHNQYLQIMLETGLIGILLFLTFLYLLWLLLLKNRKNFLGALSIAYFIAILFYESFELTLFQNNFNIGLIQWTIITVGISMDRPNKFIKRT